LKELDPIMLCHLWRAPWRDGSQVKTYNESKINNATGVLLTVSQFIRMPARQKIVGHIGLFGLYLYAISGFVSTAGINCGILFMLVGVLPSFPSFMVKLKNEPFFWSVAAFAVYVLARTGLAAFEDMHGSLSPIVSVSDLVLLCLSTLLVAWWLHGDSKRLSWVLGLALLGLVLRFARYMDWGLIANYMGKNRLGLGFTSTALGTYLAVVFIAIVLSILALIINPLKERPMFRLTAIMLLLLFSIGVGESLLLTQTRTAWFAVALVLPGACLMLGLLKLKSCESSAERRRLLIGMGGIVLFVICVVLLNSSLLSKRLNAQDGQHNFYGHLSSYVGDTFSLRERMLIWQNGLANISGKPLLGWGLGSSDKLLGQSATQSIRKYNHYHNLYIQFAVELGLLGCLLFAAIWYFALRNCWHAYCQGYISVHWLVMAFSLSATYLLTNLAQFRLHELNSRWLVTIILAMAFTAWLWRVSDGRVYTEKSALESHEVSG
jgi:O-antigen ligase